MNKYYRNQYTNLHKVLFWLTLTSVYILSILPQDQAPDFSWGDKANHILAFLVLGMLFRLAYKIGYFYSIVYLLVFGVFIEASQYLTPTRSAEFQDIAADLVGVFIGFKLYKYTYRLLK